MKPHVVNIEEETLDNTDYRRVVYTVPGSFQLVYMSIPGGQDIPEEIHPDITQFIRVESGLGIATVDGKYYALGDGTSITIPPGSSHRIESSGSEDLKLYSIYTPPEHKPGTIHKTREDAAK